MSEIDIKGVNITLGWDARRDYAAILENLYAAMPLPNPSEFYDAVAPKTVLEHFLAFLTMKYDDASETLAKLFYRARGNDNFTKMADTSLWKEYEHSKNPWHTYYKKDDTIDGIAFFACLSYFVKAEEGNAPNYGVFNKGELTAFANLICLLDERIIGENVSSEWTMTTFPFNGEGNARLRQWIHSFSPLPYSMYSSLSAFSEENDLYNKALKMAMEELEDADSPIAQALFKMRRELTSLTIVELYLLREEYNDEWAAELI